MAPGPPALGDNRFAPLLDISAKSPNPKKKKRFSNLFESFPDLPSSSIKADPKFIVISSTNQEKPLAKFSCFALHRSLQIISTEIQSISTLRDGSLLLLVKNMDIAKKFISTKELAGLCSIKCTLHEKLNITKGTVYAPYLIDVSEEEIIKESRSQGVVSIYKFARVADGKKQFTGSILLDFNMHSLPAKIDISWYTVKVREFLPNPMRCKSCQQLGHTTKWCKNNPTCGICNVPPHSPTECTRIMCANCHEDHPSSSPTCKTFKQQKEILALKTQRKCSMAQAKQLHKSLYPTNLTTSTRTYADTASSSFIATTSSFDTNKSKIKQNIPTHSKNNNITINKENSNNDINKQNIVANYKNNIRSETINNNSPQQQVTVDNSYSTTDRNKKSHINKEDNTIITQNNNDYLNNSTHIVTDSNKYMYSNLITNSENSITPSSNNNLTQNNPNFIPPNSLNHVLSKFQLSLNRSTDSD